jgi:ArsR family metal-binding transcriptional regulator
MVVEGHFGRAFSMRVLCSLLQGVAKCSEKLGVAKLSHEGCNVNIYGTGRIDVQGVASEKEAIELIDDI